MTPLDTEDAPHFDQKDTSVVNKFCKQETVIVLNANQDLSAVVIETQGMNPVTWSTCDESDPSSQKLSTITLMKTALDPGFVSNINQS